MQDRPCRCAQPYKSTKDLKKNIAGHAYGAQSCIEDRRLPTKMHDRAFHPSTTCTASRASTHGHAYDQTTQIDSVFEMF